MLFLIVHTNTIFTLFFSRLTCKVFAERFFFFEISKYLLVFIVAITEKS